MKIYNCHVHSGYSHDATGSIDVIASQAINNRLTGITISDHCDCEYYYDNEMKGKLLSSYSDTKLIAQKYAGQIEVMAGIEIGDAIFAPEFASEMISARSWDVILGSVHAVRIPGKDIPFSLIDFSKFNESELAAYTKQYFIDLSDMASNADYDILCHLTVLFRYIKYKYHRSISVSDYMEIIEEILTTIIKRDKTLEINTSGFKDGYLMPDKEIIKLYKHLGGKRYSIGNDCHNPISVSDNIAECLRLLKKEGIDTLFYYKNRKAIEYSFYDL